MGKKNFILIIFLFLLFLLAGGYFYWAKPLREEITDPLLKKIKTEGKIIVGTDATYPPMESIDERGDFIGLDIDIVKEVAVDLGVEADFRNITWDELISFNPLYREEVDMLISAITITPERAKQVAFSDPYFNAGQVIVVQKDSPIKEVEDLQGKILGVQEGTTSEEEAKKHTDPVLVKSYVDYSLVKAGLFQGEIEAILIDYPAGVGIVAKDEDLKIAGEPFTQEFYGVAVRPGEKVLLAQINQTIRRLKQEGRLRELEEKWLIQ